MGGSDFVVVESWEINVGISFEAAVANRFLVPRGRALVDVIDLRRASNDGISARSKR